MHAGFFDFYKRQILHNNDSQFDEKEREKLSPSLLIYKNGQPEVEERLILTSHPDWYDSSELKDGNHQLIHVIRLEGPITSGGAPCSYGTRELADRFSYADNVKHVVGHLVIINTPGGSARANELNELFEKANKPVVGLIRSMCCSKGVEIASHIPHVFAESRDSDIGCIGTFASFSGVKSGTVIDGETYYEVYADQSTKKNYAYREAIQNDNLKPILDELNQLNEEFIQNVRKRWPNVKPETLEGATYKAHEVEGQLFDDYKSYGEAIDYIFELAGVARLDSGVITPVGIIDEDDAIDDEDDDDFFNESTESEETSINPIKQLIPMQNIEQITSVLGGNPIQADEQSGLVQLSVDQLVQLNSYLEGLNQELADLKAKATTDATTIANLNAVIADKDQMIDQMAEATSRGIAQHSPTSDADETQVQVVESALAGIDNPQEKWKIVAQLAHNSGML